MSDAASSRASSRATEEVERLLAGSNSLPIEATLTLLNRRE